MKKKLQFLIVAVLSMFMATMGVNAEAVNCNNIEDKSGFTNALAGDCSKITLKSNASIDGDFTITKNVEIVGNGATIKGKIAIEGGTNITISDLTMTGGTPSGSEPEYISVQSEKVNLTVSGVQIYYDNMEQSAKFIKNGTGIVVYNSSGNGSTVTVTDSIIHTKYAIWIEGSNSNLTVKNSELSGYAALDLTSSSTKTSDNKVTIDNSKLTGYAIGKAEDKNNYGTIVIGYKENVTIDIINNSTITNNFDNGTTARSDLILISNANEKATNANINVSNSTLNNTATSADLGAVYNANETNGNSFKTENTTIEGNLIAGEKEQFYVEFVIDGKSNVVLVNNGKLNSSDIPNVYKSGYTFNGWYDEEGNYFDTNGDITDNIKVIAKFTSSSSSIPAKDYTIVEGVEYEENGDNIEIEGSIIKDKTDVYEAMLKYANNKGFTKLYNMYEFHVKDGKSLTNPLVITFDLGKENDGKTAYVLHQKHDNTYDEYKAVVTDGIIKIRVYELSPFIVMLEDKKNEEKEDVPQIPNTIDNIGIYSAITILGISILGLTTKKVLNKNN